MYRALISFSGIVSMTVGDIQKITDKEVIEDLIAAGYIEEVKPAKDKKTKNKKCCLLFRQTP